MTKREYRIDELDISVDVWETKRQKDLLDVLDELLENDDLHPENNVFEDTAFFIKYKDGTYYSNVDGDTEGVYKKRNIVGIHYSNPMDSQVYGAYEVNEWGCVTLV